METALDKIKKRAGKKTDTAATTTEATPVYDFFRVKKDDKGNFKDVMILQSGFTQLLLRLGFRRYDVGESFIIVRVQDNIIEQIFLHRLRRFIVSYFQSLDEQILEDMSCDKDVLIEKLFRTLGTVTTEEKMALLVEKDLDANEIKIVQDTATTAYYFYKNGFVEVTKEGAKLRPYRELPGHVWKDQIIQRDFVKMPWQEWETGMYYEFCNNISNNHLKPDGKRNDPERFKSFLTITGYCLHRFFDTKLKMPIFLDARMTEDPDGRSGKSLHCKAMRTLMNADPENGKQCVIIDGKQFDPENRFKYEDLHVSTRLVVFDDVRRGLPIELFFNSIVDGFMREQKGEKFKTRIWCKPIVTLNYTLRIRGGSAKDRVVEFEFADYYSNTRTPASVHGCWFFRDWDAQEWARFDNFMMNCITDYLQAGIVEPDTINLEARKLRDETASEFINWMEDLVVEHEKSYSKRELFKKFAEVDDSGKVTRSDFHFLKQRKFTDWLKLWAELRPEIVGYKEYRSSGTDYIRFFYNDVVQPDNLKDAILFASATRVVEVQMPDNNKDEKLPF